MRGFRCVPLSTIHSVVLSQLSSFERDCYWSGLVAQDDRHCLPFDDCALRSAIFPNRPFVGLTQIAAARGKLIARGVWVPKTSPRKEWLEIHPDYRHTEGQNETSYGDEPAPEHQGELLFEPTVLKLPRRRAEKINGSRAEQSRGDSDKPILPPAEWRPDPLKHATSVAMAPERNRVVSEGGEKQESAAPEQRVEAPRFARSVDEITATPLGRRLVTFIGPTQMLTEARESGAAWLRIIAEEGEELEELLEQGERCRGELKEGKTRAKFLTGRLAQRRAA